jgi:hypothetical protein
LAENEITISRELAFELFDVLWTAPVYALLGTEHETEIAVDFKPWKWEGYELDFAIKACEVRNKLLTEMKSQIGGNNL